MIAPEMQENSDEKVELEVDNGQNVPYTAFRPAQKRVIVFLVAIAGFFSPFSAFIYFPALDLIASVLNVSIQLMNLTVTMYLVVQGVVPSVFGEISENVGRRPVYLTVFVIYILASIGLAVQNSYGALLALRMLQSAGSSGTIALAYGVISDIAAPHERGGYVGIAHVGFDSAPSLGPVLGGILAEKAGWKWIFWFLAGLSGSVFILLLLLLPETSRKLVGNGNLHATGINQSLYDKLESWRRHEGGMGVGAEVASYAVGAIANYDYRKTAKSHNLSIDRVKGDAIIAFPIEKARLRSVWIYIFLSSTATLGYGWSVQTKTHLATPLIMQFIIGLAVTGIFNVLNTLVVDLHSDQSATASAAVSIIRCLLAAAGISVLQLLFDAIGAGWTFTLISGMCYATVPFLWLERQKGWNWRLTKAGPGCSTRTTIRC
ncbi:hypothetical protein LTS15_000709 [Exophiala xenobiotica]|nr:hypothetical protein LTS15_000709 [Exophiala xenobiotica]